MTTMESLGKTDKTGKSDKTDKTSDENDINAFIGSWLAFRHTKEENADEEILLLLDETEKSVRRMDWQNIHPILRLRLRRAIRDCLRTCTSSPQSVRLISALIELSVIDSWYEMPLTMILTGNTDSNLDHYCANINCDVLWTQLDRLSQNNCKDYALKLCSSCMNIPWLKEDPKIKDLYFTLLFELGRIELLAQELVSAYTGAKSINFVDWLLKHNDSVAALNFSSYMLEIFIVNDLMHQTTHSSTYYLMQIWFDVQQKLDVDLDLLRDRVTKLSSYFTTSAHYYITTHALVEMYGSELLQLCIGMCVKGLMIDFNSLEMARADGRNLRELEIHLANVFMSLVQIVGGQSLLARECYLSAFSVDPTADRLKKIGEFKGFAGSCHCIVKGSCDVSMCDTQLDDLPDELLEDLAVVVNKTRKKCLSWELEWSELEKNCEDHLKEKSAAEKEIFNIPTAIQNDVPENSETEQTINRKRKRESERRADKAGTNKEIFNIPTATCVGKSVTICEKDERKKIQNDVPENSYSESETEQTVNRKRKGESERRVDKARTNKEIFNVPTATCVAKSVTICEEDERIKIQNDVPENSETEQTVNRKRKRESERCADKARTNKEIFNIPTATCKDDERNKIKDDVPENSDSDSDSDSETEQTINPKTKGESERRAEKARNNRSEKKMADADLKGETSAKAAKIEAAKKRTATLVEDAEFYEFKLASDMTVWANFEVLTALIRGIAEYVQQPRHVDKIAGICYYVSDGKVSLQCCSRCGTDDVFVNYPTINQGLHGHALRVC